MCRVVFLFNRKVRWNFLLNKKALRANDASRAKMKIVASDRAGARMCRGILFICRKRVYSQILGRHIKRKQAWKVVDVGFQHGFFCTYDNFFSIFPFRCAP